MLSGKTLISILLVSSWACAEFFAARMLHEIREAEGEVGDTSLLALIGGGLHFLPRYRQAVPKGRAVLWFLRLLLASLTPIGLYFVVGFRQPSLSF